MLVWIDLSKCMKVTLNQLIIYFPSFHFQPTNRSTSQTLTAPKSAPKHFLEHTKTSTTRKLRFPPGPAVFQTRQLALKTISHPILEQRNILLETNKRTRSATENACATTEEGLFSFSRPNFSAGQLAPGGAFGRVAICQVLIFFLLSRRDKCHVDCFRKGWERVVGANCVSIRFCVRQIASIITISKVLHCRSRSELVCLWWVKADSFNHYLDILSEAAEGNFLFCSAFKAGCAQAKYLPGAFKSGWINLNKSFRVCYRGRMGE